MAETDEQTKAYIAALLNERTMHPERAKEIGRELARVGHEATPPAKRAAKRARSSRKPPVK
jgi:hypothetical protein